MKQITKAKKTVVQGTSSQTRTFKFIKEENKFQKMKTAFIFQHTPLLQMNYHSSLE